jgi:hypothetical protein
MGLGDVGAGTGDVASIQDETGEELEGSTWPGPFLWNVGGLIMQDKETLM